MGRVYEIGISWSIDGYAGSFVQMIMNEQEWGSFEIVAIGIGLLHDSSILAAHAVIANTVAFCFMVPLGISIGTFTFFELITKSGFYKSRKFLRSRTTRCCKKKFIDLYDVGW